MAQRNIARSYETCVNEIVEVRTLFSGIGFYSRIFVSITRLQLYDVPRELHRHARDTT